MIKYSCGTHYKWFQQINFAQEYETRSNLNKTFNRYDISEINDSNQFSYDFNLLEV